MPSPTGSTSPVWIPARNREPWAAASSRIATAHRIAWPGASNVARMRSAVLFRKRPRWDRTWWAVLNVSDRFGEQDRGEHAGVFTRGRCRCEEVFDLREQHVELFAFGEP